MRAKVFRFSNHENLEKAMNNWLATESGVIERMGQSEDTWGTTVIILYTPQPPTGPEA